MSKAAVLGLLALFTTATIAQERFSNALNDIDVDKILTSRRLVENYVACLIHKKTCPPQIAEIKRVLPDIMKTTCVRCSKGQVLKIEEGLTKLKKQYPGEFRKLSEVWDPTGEYYKNFQAKARSIREQGHR